MKAICIETQTVCTSQASQYGTRSGEKCSIQIRKHGGSVSCGVLDANLKDDIRRSESGSIDLSHYHKEAKALHSQNVLRMVKGVGHFFTELRKTLAHVSHLSI